eukprot:8935385-Alexandrium_andersonii.AAC.1
MPAPWPSGWPFCRRPPCPRGALRRCAGCPRCRRLVPRRAQTLVRGVGAQPSCHYGLGAGAG